MYINGDRVSWSKQLGYSPRVYEYAHPNGRKHEHRAKTIERAAEFWECNKTTALLKSVEFTCRMDANLREVLAREDLTLQQKREIAEALTIPGTYAITVTEDTQVTVE